MSDTGLTSDDLRPPNQAWLVALVLELLDAEKRDAAEILRLRAWLDWMSVDDGDAQAALDGEPAPADSVERVLRGGE